MRNGATQFLKQTENWTKQNLNCIKNTNTNTKTDTTSTITKLLKQATLCNQTTVMMTTIAQR